jgi:hypothetical protein
MTNTSYNINSLSKKEINIILESLLFASSVDVCASWYKENNLDSLELAKKIRTMFPEVILENIYIYDDEKTVLNDDHTKEIIQFFPELKKELIEIQELDTRI